MNILEHEDFDGLSEHDKNELLKFHEFLQELAKRKAERKLADMENKLQSEIENAELLNDVYNEHYKDIKNE